MRIWIIEDEKILLKEAVEQVEAFCKDTEIKATRDLIWPPDFITLNRHGQMDVEDFPDIIILDIYKEYSDYAPGSVFYKEFRKQEMDAFNEYRAFVIVWSRGYDANKEAGIYLDDQREKRDNRLLITQIKSVKYLKNQFLKVLYRIKEEE